MYSKSTKVTDPLPLSLRLSPIDSSSFVYHSHSRGIFSYCLLVCGKCFQGDLRSVALLKAPLPAINKGNTMRVFPIEATYARLSFRLFYIYILYVFMFFQKVAN